MRCALRTVLLIGLATLAVTSAYGQGGWDKQDFDLPAGWSTIWLDIDPVPAAPGDALANVDAKSIWTFVPGTQSGDPGSWASFTKGQPDFVNSLGQLIGGRGYLIELQTAQKFTLVGRPRNRLHHYSATASNLFGARSDPNASLTFDEYFSDGSTQNAIKTAFRLSGGTFSKVYPPDSQIRGAIGYWLNVSRDLDYAGCLRSDAALDGLQFAADGYTRTLNIEIPPTSQGSTITIQAVASVSPPSGFPTDAGGGDASWLEYQNPDYDQSDDHSQYWKPLTSAVTLTIAKSASTASLAIRANRLNRATATEKDTSSLYQACIQVTNALGARLTLAAGMEVAPRTGVWIGQAVLRHVSVNSAVENAFPNRGDAAEPMIIPLILAVPEDGTDAILLKKAAFDVDVDGRTHTQSYNSLLLTNDVVFDGTVNNGTEVLKSDAFVIDAHDPVNPYRHRYNPEHRVGYEIRRQITLDLAHADTDPHSDLQIDKEITRRLNDRNGNNTLVGTYIETVSGLSLEPIAISGTFRLVRMSSKTDFVR